MIIWLFISSEAFQVVVQSLDCSWLEHFGSSCSASHPITTAERSLVFNLPTFLHIIPLPHFLHWFPVPAHNRFKTRMLIYNSKNEPPVSWKQLNPALPHSPFKFLAWLSLTHHLSRYKENSGLALRWWNEFLWSLWKHAKISTCTVLYYANTF